MLISHKLKIIFIHIPKNAGTFIWHLLKTIDPELIEYFNIKDSSRKTLHNKASQIKELCGFDYSEYTIFCIIRDPIERLISLYNYIKINKDYPTHSIVVNQDFEEFINFNFSKKDFLETNYINQYQFIYDDDNNLLVDKIIKYENLETELVEFLNFKDPNITLDLKEKLKQKINVSEKFISRSDIDINFVKNMIPDIEKEMILFNY